MTTFEQQLNNSLSHAYDIERELGGGGMSRVFVATDKSLGRKVVIKLLSPELTAEVNRGRFRREIQVAAQLQHPHIVTLFSAGEDGDLVYYTMPFITGESLKSALEKNGALPVPEVVRVLYDVIDALAYAHENGVVHRDIKPANILRSGSHSLVTDFGVAKALNAAMPSGGMTSTGMAVGTPAYMSPEQLAGDPAADHRIDIYAVGLLAYELLTGKSPFVGRTPRDVLAAVLTKEPPSLVETRPDIPRRMAEMVMKCLSKDPAERPSSAMELLEALDTFSSSSGEIRTREHRVPITPTGAMAGPTIAPVTTPVTNPAVTAADPAPSGISAVDVGTWGGTVLDSPIAAGMTTPPEQAPTYEPSRPEKKRSKMLLGAVVLLVPVAAAAIFMTQFAGKNDSTESAAPLNAAVVDSALQQSPPPVVTDSASQQQTPPGAVVDSALLPKPAPAAVTPASTAAKAAADSAKKKAAADKAKRAAVAKADSLKKRADLNNATPARRAAAALLANADARKAFTRGASRTGGLLGTQRKGDLQTQIDALQPFLRNVGLTYEQFKRSAQESGVNIFDEFGRMVPEALQRFASGG